MTTDQGRRHMTASPATIAAPLLRPLGLPAWNPLFSKLIGRREPRIGDEYELVLSVGLRGSFSYSSLDPEAIGITWQVPGMREESVWIIRAVPGGSLVSHRLDRTGPLAHLMGGGIRGVAHLRLERLARVARDAAEPPDLPSLLL